MKVKIEFDVPEEAGIDVTKLALKESKELYIAMLYTSGVLTLKQARLIIGKTRREFDDLLTKSMLPVMNAPDENLRLDKEYLTSQLQ